MNTAIAAEARDRIEYQQFGHDGPVVVWLHGLDGPEPDRPVIDRLARRYRVFVPTFPGFDDSERPDHCDSVGDLVHLCFGLLEDEDLRDVMLIGSSFGGWIAAELAFWRPQRLAGVVLIDALGIRVGSRTDRDIADLFVVSAEHRRALLFHDPANAGPLPTELEDAELLRRLRSQEASVVYGWEPYMCNPKLLRRLRSVTLPAQVIWGAEDRVVSVQYGEAFAAALANADFAVLSDAGHNAHLEQTEGFLALVDRFIEQCSPSPTNAPKGSTS
jgi:pimeloyl-ACP methyl ester carboxylesterase